MLPWGRLALKASLRLELAPALQGMRLQKQQVVRGLQAEKAQLSVCVVEPAGVLWLLCAPCLLGDVLWALRVCPACGNLGSVWMLMASKLGGDAALVSRALMQKGVLAKQLAQALLELG